MLACESVVTYIWSVHIYIIYICVCVCVCVCVCGSIVNVYMEYTQYTPCICRCHTYTWYIPSLEQMDLYSTFFYDDIPLIYQVNFKNILGVSKVYHFIKRYRTNPFVLDQVYTRWYMYDNYIYMEYTMYILCIHYVYTGLYTGQGVIHQLYTRNIHGIYHMVHTMYIHILLL